MPLHRAGVLKFIQQPMVKRSIKAILKVELPTSQGGSTLARGKQYRQIRKSQPTHPAHLRVIALFKRPKQPMDALCTRKLYGEFLSHAMAQNTRKFLAEFRGGAISLTAIDKFPFTAFHRLEVFHGQPHQRWGSGEKIFSGSPGCKVVGHSPPVILQGRSKTLIGFQVRSPVGDHVRQRYLLLSPWVAGRPNQRRISPSIGIRHAQEQLMAALEMLLK